MGLRVRDRTETPAAPHPPIPRPADRLRRPLALAAALAALVAFTSLARPQASPSSRLRIGADPGVGAQEAPDRTAARTPARQGHTLVRPLDPVTLADVPANILALGDGEWIAPSAGGALLALQDHSPDEIQVLDAETLQPVVTLEAAGAITGVYGFSPGDEAVVAQVRAPYPRHSVLRYPLDPEQPVTGVELPEAAELASDVALLPDGRAAMVVAQRTEEDPASERSPVRVLVADLVQERMLVDLPLPGVRADFIYGVPEPHTSQALPAFAWDPARARLYVVHADVARVSVIDLAGGALLAEADVGPPLPEISGESGQRWRWAQVSPDGTRLYTAGYESSHSSGTVDLFDLQVIDTATLSEIGRVQDVDNVQLSPDGRWLLWSRNAEWTGLGSPNELPRVALMDTARIGEVHLLGDRTAAYPLGFSRDSSHAYVQRDDVGGGAVVAHALPSLTETGERLLSHDAWFDPTTRLLHETG